MPFLFDPDTARYIDEESGRLVKRAFLFDKSGGSLVDSKDTIDIITEQFNDAIIGLEELREAGRIAIKDEAIRQYLLGRGGREQMTQSDWGSTGAIIGEQYKFWENFMQEIGAGLVSPGQIQARARMYIHSTVEGFWRARGKNTANLGFTEVKWNLGATEAHCPTCQEWASIGWLPACENGGYPVDGGCQFPGNGNTECLTNCVCDLSYRNAEGKRYNG